MLTRKQKTYSILDDEIDEDNVVVGHKSTRNTDSNKKRFKNEIIESQDDDDEVVRRSINVFEQDDITTMVLGTWGSSFQIWGFWSDKCNFYMIFIILLFIRIVSFPLFLLILFYFYFYLSIHLCFEGMRRFRLIYKGFTCKVGLGQLNQVNLHPARHEFKRIPAQLNLSPTRVRNQRKFALNLSPIWIRISACTSVSIFGITFGSDIQSR